MPDFPLVGRRREVAVLSAALRSRQSLLITGAAGIGKTRILRESLAAAKEPFIEIGQPAVLHDLLVRLAGCLDCSQAATSQLKPLVLQALRARGPCIVMEDVCRAGPRTYRFLQQVYYLPHTCLVVTARSASQIGYLRRLLWDPREEMALQPLTQPESLRLFEQARMAFGLDACDVDEFRDKALHAARGNPGQILGMCRLASQAQYRSGRHIKFAPLRIDLMTAFVR